MDRVGMSPPEAPVPPTPRHMRARAAWDRELQAPLTLEGGGEGVPEAWFLGPRAENVGILHELIAAAIDSHAEFRRGFHPEDPSHITAAVRHSPGFQAGMDRLRRETHGLLDKLRLSAPFASMRHQGHMLWDQALPAMIGQFAAGLYNQNNVAAEASPVTTRLEIEVGNDLCRMLGYEVSDTDTLAAGEITAWGHITSGGTVANIEALWAARNLTFAGVALRAAVREIPLLAPARGLEVPLWSGGTARLIDLDTWTLLNLDLDTLAGLPAALTGLGINPEAATDALAGYTVQNVGLIGFYRSFMTDFQELPVLLAPATGHYSWPKAATLLGLGRNALLVQRVDMDARLDLEHVEVTLTDLLRRRTPVLAVVAAIGSTEESAVDPLAGLLELRERFRARGLNFAIHADAAWGGYFRSMLRDEGTPEGCSSVPTATMSDYVRTQYEALPRADSITVDPHKGGYVPYPAGALCYRNAAFRDAVSLRAPVVFHSQAEPTVGVYGIEGSKPGAAAAAVWLAHRVIRPDRSGYGRILGQCMWTSKRLFCRLATLEDPRFSITLFNRHTRRKAARAGASAAKGAGPAAPLCRARQCRTAGTSGSRCQGGRAVQPDRLGPGDPRLCAQRQAAGRLAKPRSRAGECPQRARFRPLQRHRAALRPGRGRTHPDQLAIRAGHLRAMVRRSVLPPHGRRRGARPGRRFPDLHHHGPLDDRGERHRFPGHDRRRASPRGAPRARRDAGPRSRPG